MLDLLIDFLHQYTSVSYTTLMTSLINKFYALGIYSFETDLIPILKNADNEDPSTVLGAINYIVVNKASELLQAQGVSINTGDIYFITELIAGIDDIQSYNDPDTICRICESGLDEIETFSQLMELVTTLHATTMHEYLTFIDPKVISILHTRADSLDHLTAAVYKDKDQNILDRLNKWTKVNPDSIVKIFLDKNITVGLPYSNYLDLIKSNMILSESLVFNDDIKETAKNVLSIVLYSNTINDNIKNDCQVIIDDYYLDIDFIQKLDIEMDTIKQKVLYS